MRPLSIRLLISTILILHLSIVTIAMLGHRGASYLHDDFLSVVAPYTAFGNWRADTNRMPIASNSQLEEIVRVEWHKQDTPADSWVTLVPFNQPREDQQPFGLTREQRFEQQWLHQLSGLLVYDNDEGAGRMLMAAMKKEIHQGSEQMDKIRVTVAPRLSLQQFSELEANDELNKLPQAYLPQIAYLASILDLGDGELSLLRQMEARRASKTLAPSNRSPSKGGDQP